MYNDSKNQLNPCKTPDRYFSNLEKCIVSKIVIKNNIKYSWKTPNNYFESLEKNILTETVNKVNPKKPKIYTLSPKKIYWLSAAACLFFAILLGVYSIDNQHTNYSLVLTDIENQKTLSDDLYTPNPLDSSMSSLDWSSSTNKISCEITQISNQRIQKPTELTKEKILEQEIVTSHVIYDLYLANDETTNLYDEEISKDNYILF